MKRKYRSVAFSDAEIDRAIADGIMMIAPPEPVEICDRKIRGFDPYVMSTPSRQAFVERMKERIIGKRAFGSIEEYDAWLDANGIDEIGG